MKIAEFLPAIPNRLWDLTAQIGVTHAICKCAPDLTGLKAPDDLESLRIIQERFAERGFTLAGLEGDQFDMSRIKMGLPGRDEDLERYRKMLRNMAELGIPLLCYNFMAGTGWYRGTERIGRGGARCTSFSLAETPAVLPGAPLEAEKLWENYEYFLRAVLPEAERLGIRMGLHPDDPPLPSLGGIARIFGSVDGFDRAYSILPCQANAVTYCQANFKLMGADLSATARHFGDRIAFVHIRDVNGTAEDFVELFHDEGSVDQLALFHLYRELGLEVPFRCDHVPTMEGEGNEPGFVPGYGTLGRLFANGYLKGLLQASAEKPVRA